MKIKRTLLVFLAGAAAYASMAACSGGSETNGAGTGGAASASTTGQSVGSTGGASASGGHGQGGNGGQAGAGGAGAGGGGTRLKKYFSKGTDGTTDDVLDMADGFAASYQPRHRWLDSERNEDCVFQPTSDGKMHCLPIGMATALTYTNLNGPCRQVVVTEHGDCSPHEYYADLDYPLCQPPSGSNPSIKSVSSVGAFIGTDECTFRDAACTQGSCGLPSHNFYELGMQIDLGDFVAATPMTDP